MTETRKLAAILVADVVGYSRLAGADEERTLARLRGLRSDLIDPAIAANHGRIVKRTGDGGIIEFRSVVDAVRCAIEVQTGLIERNAGLPPERRIQFRVGIHLGDVVEESDGDLMGDGVNVAARLEGICEPGGICLSEDAYRQVKSRLELAVADLGPQHLKNIAEPVHAYLLRQGAPVTRKARRVVTKPRGAAAGWTALAALVVALLAAGGYAWHAGYAPRLFGVSAADDKLANAARLSIVVLPFQNLSGDPEQEYFADAITDDLTTDLSHLEGSFVIARGTAFTYKGKPVDAKQIGRELGVRYLLEGSVRRVGETITLNAQLISTETGAHVWADRFDGERGKLGLLQVEFVSRLANSLGVELVKAEALRAARERPSNPDAVDLAMEGWASLSGGFNKANYDAAIGYFERALQLDPQLTRAQVGLAWGLVDRMYPFRGGDIAVDLPRAEGLLMKALAAEPNSAWAHYVRADLLAYGKKQINDALSELGVAIENDRNFARAYGLRGGVLILGGEAKKAIPEAETALQLSPRDPLRNQWEFRICHAHAHMAEWETAVEWCQKSVATNAGFWVPYVDLVAANGWLGRDADAKAAIDGLHKLMPGFTVLDWASIRWSDNPQFQREYARIAEGLRKAGLPEGAAKSN
jgi:class 3 adenylate cyclase/TolB-like protein